MIQNATLAIFSPLVTKNSEGTTVKFWAYKGLFGGVWDDEETWDDTLRFGDGPSSSSRCDVQAGLFTQAQLEAWGISTKQSDIKKAFLENLSDLVILNRVSVLSDFDATLKYYEIRAVNRWPIHAEAILVPIQGEA